MAFRIKILSGVAKLVSGVSGNLTCFSCVMYRVDDFISLILSISTSGTDLVPFLKNSSFTCISSARSCSLVFLIPTYLEKCFPNKPSCSFKLGADFIIFYNWFLDLASDEMAAYMSYFSSASWIKAYFSSLSLPTFQIFPFFEPPQGDSLFLSPQRELPLFPQSELRLLPPHCVLLLVFAQGDPYLLLESLRPQCV